MTARTPTATGARTKVGENQSLRGFALIKAAD